MHKKIAELIKKMVDESPYDHFECEVIPSATGTGGFWAVRLTFDSMDDAHSYALLEAIPHIGQVYGETIHLPDRGKIMIIG